MNIFRWILVLPLAILAAVASTFLFHFLLSLLAMNGSISILGFQISERADIDAIEYMFYPLFVAGAFIIGGYKAAPSNKFNTALVLFGIYIVVMLVGSIYVSNESTSSFSWRNLLALLGAVLGMLEVYIEESKINKGKVSI